MNFERSANHGQQAGDVFATAPPVNEPIERGRAGGDVEPPDRVGWSRPENFEDPLDAREDSADSTVRKQRRDERDDLDVLPIGVTMEEEQRVAGEVLRSMIAVVQRFEVRAECLSLPHARHARIIGRMRGFCLPRVERVAYSAPSRVPLGEAARRVSPPQGDSEGAGSKIPGANRKAGAAWGALRPIFPPPALSRDSRLVPACGPRDHGVQCLARIDSSRKTPKPIPSRRDSVEEQFASVEPFLPEDGRRVQGSPRFHVTIEETEHVEW